jgi:2-polyprenyl-3-methyl-5-hydroxy-6-metoxy-1,4-benzoquinol methylase
MRYLENNPIRGEGSFIQRVIGQILRKKYRVTDHYQLYFPFFLDLLKIKRKVSICDIGGADGWAISSRDKRIDKRTVLDMDDTYKKQVESKGYSFEIENLETELKNPSKHDIIHMSHVLEHVWNYDTLLKNLRAMLNEKGIVIIRCPNIKKNGFKFYDEFTHVRAYTPHAVKQLFESYGFKTIAIKQFSYNRLILSLLINNKIGRKLAMKGPDVLYIGRKIIKQTK